MCGTVDPATKNLNFKNLLRKSLPVKSPLYKNLCGLKFKTGSFFLKSMKKCFTLGKLDKSTFRIIFGDIGALSFQLQDDGMQILYEE